MKHLKEYKVFESDYWRSDTEEGKAAQFRSDIEYADNMISDIKDDYQCFVDHFESDRKDGIRISIFPNTTLNNRGLGRGIKKAIEWVDLENKPYQIIDMLKLEGSEYELHKISISQLGGFSKEFKSIDEVKVINLLVSSGQGNVFHSSSVKARYKVLEPGMNEYIDDMIYSGYNSDTKEYNFIYLKDFPDEDDFIISLSESELETDVIVNINRVDISILQK